MSNTKVTISGEHYRGKPVNGTFQALSPVLTKNNQFIYLMGDSLLCKSMVDGTRCRVNLTKPDAIEWHGPKPIATGLSQGTTEYGVAKPGVLTDSSETNDEIRTRVGKLFKIMRKMAKSVALPQYSTYSAVISGPPGIGKSHEIHEELMALRTDGKIESLHIEKGTVSPVNVFKILQQNKNAGQVTVFDDIDSVFDQQAGLNILKAATDSKKERTVSWATDYRELAVEGLEKTFTYEGSVLFLTNRSLQDEVDRKVKNYQHIRALISRSMYLDMGFKTPRDILVRISDIAPIMLRNEYELTQADTDEIVAFMFDNVDKLKNVDLRMVGQLANAYKMDPDDWYDLAEMTCFR